jgi:hypothetical protein
VSNLLSSAFPLIAALSLVSCGGGSGSTANDVAQGSYTLTRDGKTPRIPALLHQQPSLLP